MCHNCGMTVYVDVLLFINTVWNYAILITADALLKRQCRLRRLIAGAFTGALFSLSIFLSLDSFWFLLLIKVLSSLTLTAVTFGFHSRGSYLRALGMTFFVSLLYCGAVILFYQIFKPPRMLIINDVPYLQINPAVMLVLTAVIYLLLLLFNKLFYERIKTTVVSLRFSVSQKEYSCIGKIDTGCNLIEPFSKSPVIIADSTVIQLPEDAPARVIPYTTVGGASFLRAVKADRVIIDRQKIDKPIYIAASNELNPQFHAIINSDILR